MISQSELPPSLNIPSLVPSSFVLAKYLWPPLPPAPQLFTTPWAGAVGSLIDSTFFFSTPYYSSSTFNSSFFICFSIQHVIFQKTTFSIECNFRRKWRFCIWKDCYDAKMIIFCRRVKDILQRLPRLVLSMEVATVAKRWILSWKRNFEKKNLYSRLVSK